MRKTDQHHEEIDGWEFGEAERTGNSIKMESSWAIFSKPKQMIRGKVWFGAPGTKQLLGKADAHTHGASVSSASRIRGKINERERQPQEQSWWIGPIMRNNNMKQLFKRSKDQSKLPLSQLHEKTMRQLLARPVLWMARAYMRRRWKVCAGYLMSFNDLLVRHCIHMYMCVCVCVCVASRKSGGLARWFRE